MLISAERAAEIAVLFYDDIYRFSLSRLKNEDNASDVTHEVFLLFQEQYSGLEDDNIRAWLYAVADNKIKEKFREIARHEKERLLSIFTGETSTEIIFEMEEDNKITDEEIEKKKKSILDSLNDKELRLFELVYTKHMEYEELAKALDISENNARVRVHRLRAKIKERASYIFMAILLLFMRF